MIKREDIPNKAPKTSGVYFLYSKRKKLVYVGRSRSNLRNRLMQHSNLYDEAIKWVKNKKYHCSGEREFAKPFEFFRISIVKDKKEVDKLEKELIKYLNPKFNYKRTFFKTDRNWEDLLDKL
jgi:excinuclease UvrABC nuclease subunit